MPQSTSTRIAYAKRMLKRIEGEKCRIARLVAEGELSAEGAEIAKKLLNKAKDELIGGLKE
jgi:hypothetical protein